MNSYNNIFENILINNRIKWSGNISRINDERIPKIFNIKVIRPWGRPRSRWKQQARKDVTCTEGRTWEDNDEGLWEDRQMQTLGCWDSLHKSRNKKKF
jgi:hypothetical protein